MVNTQVNTSLRMSPPSVFLGIMAVPSSFPDIYQYTDYRAFLRDWFEQSKLQSPHVSYRYLARRTDVDAGYLARVFQGTKHLSDTAVERFIQLLGLGPKEQRYFAEMVRFGKARREDEIRERFDKLAQLRDSGVRVLGQQEYRYWMHWYIPAIRLTLLNDDFSGDFSALAERLTPAITASQAQEAVQLLLDLGLVKQRPDGIYEVQDTHLSTGDSWASAAIREFQAKTLDLARESLHIHSPALREIATLTLAIPAEEIATLQEMMREFRSRVAKWAIGLGQSNCVMQFDLACFPLSLPAGALSPSSPKPTPNPGTSSRRKSS